MFPPCTKSPDARHNFNPENGECVWQCGTNQRGKPKPMPDLFGMNLGGALTRAMNARAPRKGIHSELHQLIAEMIVQFREPSKIRVGTREVSTFGYYLGRLKKIPISLIYQWRSEIKQARDIRNEGKVFWWKYREYMKDKKAQPKE